jgi:hypothetical protein
MSQSLALALIAELLLASRLGELPALRVDGCWTAPGDLTHAGAP